LDQYLINEKIMIPAAKMSLTGTPLLLEELKIAILFLGLVFLKSKNN
jgi:hypothetical protein